MRTMRVFVVATASLLSSVPAGASSECPRPSREYVWVDADGLHYAPYYTQQGGAWEDCRTWWPPGCEQWGSAPSWPTATDDVVICKPVTSASPACADQVTVAGRDAYGGTLEGSFTGTLTARRVACSGGLSGTFTLVDHLWPTRQEVISTSGSGIGLTMTASYVDLWGIGNAPDAVLDGTVDTDLFWLESGATLRANVTFSQFDWSGGELEAPLTVPAGGSLNIYNESSPPSLMDLHSTRGIRNHGRVYVDCQASVELDGDYVQTGVSGTKVDAKARATNGVPLTIAFNLEKTRSHLSIDCQAASGVTGSLVVSVDNGPALAIPITPPYEGSFNLGPFKLSDDLQPGPHALTWSYEPASGTEAAGCEPVTFLFGSLEKVSASRVDLNGDCVVTARDAELFVGCATGPALPYSSDAAVLVNGGRKT